MTRHPHSDAPSIRDRLEQALEGVPVEWPVYLAYDWFVQNRPIDWEGLFALGLGELKHADLVRVERPNVEIVETVTQSQGGVLRQTRWITDRGELRESWMGDWRTEFPIKRPEDYRVMARAWEGARCTADPGPFLRAEAAVGARGMTVGHLGWSPLRRVPLMTLHVDFAGPERVAYDLADCRPELMDLHDLLADVTCDMCREACKTPAQYVKLWDNLSIEMIGPRAYRELLVPAYRRMLEIFASADKRLLVHYDGRLRAVADDVAALEIDGIDSFTEPPEGDMRTAEARARWPEKFLWLHPSLGWFRGPAGVLEQNIRRMAREAGPRRYCFLISEEAPPDWRHTVPVVLNALAELSGEGPVPWSRGL